MQSFKARLQILDMFTDYLTSSTPFNDNVMSGQLITSHFHLFYQHNRGSHYTHSHAKNEIYKPQSWAEKRSTNGSRSIAKVQYMYSFHDTQVTSYMLPTTELEAANCYFTWKQSTVLECRGDLDPDVLIYKQYEINCCLHQLCTWALALILAFQKCFNFCGAKFTGKHWDWSRVGHKNIAHINMHIFRCVEHKSVCCITKLSNTIYRHQG